METSLTVGAFSYDNDQILGSCDKEMVTNSHGSQVVMTFVSSATAHPTLDEDGRRELFLQLTLVSPADQVDEKVSDDIRVIS